MAAHSFRSPYSRQIALWVLRAFSTANARKSLFCQEGYGNREIAKFLGLPKPFHADAVTKIPAMLDATLANLESSHEAFELPQRTAENVSHLARMCRLNSTERAILQYLICRQVHPILIDAIYMIRRQGCDINSASHFSHILGLPRTAIVKALLNNERLKTCGLLDRTNGDDDSIDFFSKDVARQIFHGDFDPGNILRQFGSYPPPPDLAITDYPHIRSDLNLLLPYIKKSISSKKNGVNILFHGPPGTGKSQLARAIGQKAGIPVFELATEDCDGEPIPPICRLNVIQTSLSVFRDKPTLLIFDEAEDIFSSSSTERSVAAKHKGWFNRILETHSLPVIWISNSIESLDSAFLRRFDFIIEVPIPPKKQRRKILHDMVGAYITPDLIGKLAESEHISPAVVARTHDVIRSIGKALPAAGKDAAFSRILVNTLKAQGHPDPTKATIQVIQPGLYDITHLNTTADLRMIASQLGQSPSARLCLYGPPGTGKTSFGHWLAREISQPLLIRKASDLLSPYVGMTEIKIAKVFAQATEDGAVLLIDEVDSFLQDRTRSKHSWEVTQINEMLTQIESFPGILIASTNLVEHLDPASIRRFDIKIHFGYLLPEQSTRLLVSHCRNLNIPAPTPDDLALVATLDTATPGDFAAVARQHKFQPFRNASTLLQAVIEELGYKSGRLRRIGFQ
jgi:transitional endoplasmic reticulum ATPase